MAHHEHFDPSAPGHGYEAEATDQEHGHAGVGKYIAVFVALLALTLVSFGVGNWPALRQNAPGTMWAMMMAVSCCKALLVILFFMHILWEANWKYVLTIPASMMSIFLLLMLIPDIGRRTEKYSEERWLNAAKPEPQHVPGAPAHAEHDSAHPHEHDHDGKGGTHGDKH